MPSQVYRGALQSVYDLPARVTTSSQNPPPQKNLRVGNIFYGYELFPAIFLIPDMNNVIPELMPDLRQSSMGSCCVGTVPLAETAKSEVRPLRGLLRVLEITGKGWVPWGRPEAPVLSYMAKPFVCCREGLSTTDCQLDFIYGLLLAHNDTYILGIAYDMCIFFWSICFVWFT